MAIVACPFCFSWIDSSRLAFQCMGRSTPKCEKASDPKRQELTGSTAESYPTFDTPYGMPSGKKVGSGPCPRCKGHTGRRACPACHTGLPRDFIDSASPLIGIVGARASGKTVWMTVLARQLREVIAGRFSAYVAFASDTPDGASSMGAWRADREDQIFKDHQLPPPTSPMLAQRRAPLALRWQQPSRGIRKGVDSTVLSFIDTAGEDLQDLDSAFTLRYLAVSRGLIVVVDPFRFDGAATMTNVSDLQRTTGDGGPTDVVERTTDVLRTEHGVKPKKKIEIPVAVVFTKLDAFFPHLEPGNPLRADIGPQPFYDEARGREIHEQVLSLMGRWGAGHLDHHMQLNYERFRYFGVSALGAEPNYVSRTVNAGGVRPHRVEDPVLWLLSMFGVVPKG
jgi:hypothetical protein